jgi:flagellar secretion chaperone FliS
MMNPYKDRALEGASGVELTIALYDGIIRFMRSAIDAVESGDIGRRRAEVKRAMDIILHLQGTLKADVGGKPAEALSEFYVAMFALMLQGSQGNSRKKFEAVIANVWNVREAWRQVDQNPLRFGIPVAVASDSRLQPVDTDHSMFANGELLSR